MWCCVGARKRVTENGVGGESEEQLLKWEKSLNIDNGGGGVIGDPNQVVEVYKF